MRVEKNRKRYRTVAFRMSEEEWIELHERIALSGRQKQDYFIQSVLYQQIVIVGNRIQSERLERTLDGILEEMVRLDNAGDIDVEILAPLRTAIEMIRL